MREIKFRGRLLSGGGWSEGNLVIGNIHNNPEMMEGV